MIASGLDLKLRRRDERAVKAFLTGTKAPMELDFPIEFLVHGTPVSSQSTNPKARIGWKNRVKAASAGAIPQPHFASRERMAVTLFYLPEARMQGDVDNIVKLILDALSAHIYIDDTQVERVLVQKFEPGNIFNFSNPAPVFVRALAGPKPVLYVRVSNDPFEELK